MSKKQEREALEAEAVARRRANMGLDKDQRSFTEDPAVKCIRLERENAELKEQSVDLQRRLQAYYQNRPAETYEYRIAIGQVDVRDLNVAGSEGWCVTTFGVKNGEPVQLLRRRLT